MPKVLTDTVYMKNLKGKVLVSSLLFLINLGFTQILDILEYLMKTSKFNNYQFYISLIIFINIYILKGAFLLIILFFGGNEKGNEIER